METRDVQTGFTLVELMFTVTLAAILLTFAVPALREAMINNQLNRATDEVYELFMEARSVSIQKNQDVYLSFATLGGNAQCLGYNLATACDCASGGCQKNLSNDRYGNISYVLTTGNTTAPTFTPSGWSANPWQIDIKAWNDSAKTQLSRSRQVRITSTGLIIREGL